MMRWLLALILSISAAAVSAASDTNVPLQKVSVLLEWKYQFEFAGFIAAREKGFYQEAGLDVDLIEYQPGTDNLESLLNGDVDFAIQNSIVTIRDGHVAPTVLLATYLQRSPLIFVANPEIETPLDLIGKTIMGTTEELRYSTLALLLDHFGVNDRNTHIVEQTFHVEDFATGKVDAMSAFRSNQLFELDQMGVPYTVIDPAEFGFISTAVNIVSSRDQVLEDPDLARRFVTASNRGWEYAIEHPEEVVDLILERYSTRKSRESLLFEAAAMRQMMQLEFFPIGTVSEELGQRMFRQLVRSGLLADSEAYKQLTFDQLMAGGGDNPALSNRERRFLEEKGEIRFCVNPSWMPLEGIDDGRHVGVIATMFEHVAKTLLPVPVHLVPTATWAESQSAVRDGRCDMLTAAAKTPGRDASLDFTDPYMDATMVLATRTETPYIDDLAQLKDVTIGVLGGSAAPTVMKQRYPAIRTAEFRSVDDGLKAVEKGDVYGFVGTVSVISNQIQRSYVRELKISGRLDNPIKMAFAVRKDEPQLLAVMQSLAEHLNNDKSIRQTSMNRWVTVTEQTGVKPETIFKVLGGAGLIALIVAFYYLRLHRYNRQLELLTITDPLTGLYNRIHGDKALTSNFERLKRYGERCGLMMIDIDDFKAINDQYGHNVGDRVLVKFASIIKKHLRTTDVVCRWGGEEFLVICPHIDRAAAARTAEKLLELVRSATVEGAPGFTVSIGVAELESDSTVDDSLKRADDALYNAKRGGKDRVVTAD